VPCEVTCNLMVFSPNSNDMTSEAFPQRFEIGSCVIRGRRYCPIPCSMHLIAQEEGVGHD
jgi:hypothetical protein